MHPLCRLVLDPEAEAGEDDYGHKGQLQLESREGQDIQEEEPAEEHRDQGEYLPSQNHSDDEEHQSDGEGCERGAKDGLRNRVSSIAQTKTYCKR